MVQRRTLKLTLPMMRGDDVKEMQKRINRFWVEEGPTLRLIAEDGIFGEDTHSALQCLQDIMSLKPDGICGPATYAVLDKYK